jgi:hypothetical protein
MHVRLTQSEQVLAPWQRLVVFSKAMNLLHWAMCAIVIVQAHCHIYQYGKQSGYILHPCFVCCRPGGRRGNTEQVVT